MRAYTKAPNSTLRHVAAGMLVGLVSGVVGVALGALGIRILDIPVTALLTESGGIAVSAVFGYGGTLMFDRVLGLGGQG